MAQESGRGEHGSGLSYTVEQVLQVDSFDSSWLGAAQWRSLCNLEDLSLKHKVRPRRDTSHFKWRGKIGDHCSPNWRRVTMYMVNYLWNKPALFMSSKHNNPLQLLAIFVWPFAFVPFCSSQYQVKFAKGTCKPTKSTLVTTQPTTLAVLRAGHRNTRSNILLSCWLQFHRLVQWLQSWLLWWDSAIGFRNPVRSQYYFLVSFSFRKTGWIEGEHRKNVVAISILWGKSPILLFGFRLVFQRLVGLKNI